VRRIGDSLLIGLVPVTGHPVVQRDVVLAPRFRALRQDGAATFDIGLRGLGFGVGTGSLLAQLSDRVRDRLNKFRSVMGLSDDSKESESRLPAREVP
jgi:hypothetical protein